MSRQAFFVFWRIFAAVIVSALMALPAGAQGDRISNVFVETDLRQALQDLSAQAGINIIVDPSVSGVVTVGLQEVSVDEALTLLLAGTGYLTKHETDYILVYSPDVDTPSFNDASSTRIVKVRSLSASSARSLMPPAFQRFIRVDDTTDTLAITAPGNLMVRILADIETIDSGRATRSEFVPLVYVRAAALQALLPPALRKYVAVDAERNTLAVSAPPDIRSEIMANIAELDVPRAAGSFNVPDVHSTHLVKLAYATAETTLALLPPAVQEYVRADTVSNALAISAPPVLRDRILSDILAIDVPRRHIMLNARVVVLDRADLLDFGGEWRWPTVSAGTVIGDAVKWPWELRIGYSPGREFTNSLAMTLNLLSQNNEATIIASPQVLAQDGKEAEIRVTTEEYFQIIADNGAALRSELEKIETGTILKITPQVGRNGELTLSMEIEVSDVVARGEKNLPVVSRRTTHSTVQLQDGGTAAVAGLVDTRSQLGDAGVPGMRNVPILGRAFRTETLNHQAKQVAVFVTATIVNDGDAEFMDGRPTPPPRVPLRNDEAAYRLELQAALAKLLDGKVSK